MFISPDWIQIVKKTKKMPQQVSINEKDWDLHVSFTVMSLVASPDGKYLLGATDKSRCVEQNHWL